MEYLYRNSYGFIAKGKILRISDQAVYLCGCMDGKNSDNKLRQMFKKKYGIKLTLADFEKFIHKIESNNLLIGRVNNCLVSNLNYYVMKKQQELIAKRSIREPVYAGICYKYHPEELKRDLGECFASVNSLGSNIPVKKIRRLRGIIVPHSNIELSGPCAAWAYKVLDEMPMPEVFVFLAPDHSWSLKYPFSILLRDFRTPLGLIKVDKDFCRMLAKKKCGFSIFANNLAHLVEHAIEIQLPFLQYIYRQNMERVRIIPIICGNEPQSMLLKTKFKVLQKQFLHALKETIMEGNKRVVFVATGDLCHIGGWKTTHKFHERNKEIINLLKKANAEDFIKRFNSECYSSCGKMSFYTFLKMVKPATGRVLNYSWASKPSILRKNVRYEELINIGYVSMVFY